jgi:hypothetical protein
MGTEVNGRIWIAVDPNLIHDRWQSSRTAIGRTRNGIRACKQETLKEYGKTKTPKTFCTLHSLKSFAGEAFGNDVRERVS